MSDLAADPTPRAEPEDDTARQTAEPPRDSALTKRLAARATDPLGLIDVRHARAHHARITGWVAERLALVEHLRARYGLTDDAARGELALAVAFGQTTGESFDQTAAYDMNHADGMTRTAEQFNASRTAAASHAADESPATPLETLRISRRGVPTFSRINPTTDTQQRTRSEQPARDAATPERTSDTTERASDATAPPVVAELRAPHQPAPTETMELTSRPTALPARQDETRTRARERQEAAATNDVRAATKQHLSSAPSRPQTSGELLPLRSSVESVNRDTSKLAGAVRPADLPLVIPSTAAPEVREEGAAALTRRDRATGASGSAAETFAATPVASVPRAPVAKEIVASLARAKEMPPASGVRETMTYQAQRPMPLAVGRGVERETETTTRQAPASSGANVSTRASAGDAETIVTGYGAAPTKPPAVNVGNLAEQVSRHLARRLLVERERRGLGRR